MQSRLNYLIGVALIECLLLKVDIRNIRNLEEGRYIVLKLLLSRLHLVNLLNPSELQDELFYHLDDQLRFRGQGLRNLEFLILLVQLLGIFR